MSIQVAIEPGVNYTIQFIGVKKGEERSQIVKTVKGAEASIKLTSDFIFIRARILSSKPKANRFQEGDIEMAWTQPVSGNR